MRQYAPTQRAMGAIFWYFDNNWHGWLLQREIITQTISWWLIIPRYYIQPINETRSLTKSETMLSFPRLSSYKIVNIIPCRERPPVLRDPIIQWSLYSLAVIRTHKRYPVPHPRVWAITRDCPEPCGTVKWHLENNRILCLNCGARSPSLAQPSGIVTS